MEKYDSPKFWSFRGSHWVVVLVKGVLKICSKFTRENPCRRVWFQKSCYAFVFSCKFAAYFQSTLTKSTCGRLLRKLSFLSKNFYFPFGSTNTDIFYRFLKFFSLDLSKDDFQCNHIFLLYKAQFPKLESFL